MSKSRLVEASGLMRPVSADVWGKIPCILEMTSSGLMPKGQIKLSSRKDSSNTCAQANNNNNNNNNAHPTPSYFLMYPHSSAPARPRICRINTCVVRCIVYTILFVAQTFDLFTSFSLFNIYQFSSLRWLCYITTLRTLPDTHTVFTVSIL